MSGEPLCFIAHFLCFIFIDVFGKLGRKKTKQKQLYK